MHDIAFIDETFDINLTHSYELSIQLTLNGFSFCILDTVRNKCIGLSHFELDEDSTFDEILNRVEDIIKSELNEFTEYKFKKVKCIYHSPRYNIIPEELFDKSNLHEYFKFSNYLEELDEINYYHSSSTKTYIVYTIPSTLSNLLIQKFSNIKFYNHIAPAIENIAHTQFGGQNKVCINTDNGHLDILSVKDGNIQLINSFPFDNEKDASYYILNTFEQLGFNQNDIPIFYSGNNDKLALLLPEIKKYIKSVKAIKMNDKFTYSYQFNKLSIHRFANLINSFLCE